MTYYNKKRKKTNSYKQLFSLLILCLVCYLFFNLGKSNNQGNLNYCNSELYKKQEKINAIQAEKIELQKSIETLNIEKSILTEKYKELAESEDVIKLFNKINSKIDSGIAIDRIDNVVDKLKNDRKCSLTTNKRFIVKTPLYKGDIKNTNLSFENGLFDITSYGYSFINSNNKPESWFDADKAISLNFTTQTGTEVIKEKLPIKKSIILKGKEYFFEITKSRDRGFVNISEYSCSYP